MGMFRELLWGLNTDPIFPIADEKVVDALLNDETFNPKHYVDNVRLSSVKAATPTLSTMFTNNTLITHFEEFALFPTTEILDNLFQGCTSLGAIVLPTNLTTIGSESFRSCTALTSISLPSKLTTIGFSAFRSSAVNITEVPSTVTSMQTYAFAECTGLTTMDFLYKGTTIPLATFANSSLQSITLADNITSISAYTFDSCSNLTTVTMSDNVTSFGDYAFNACTELSMTALPNSLKSIGLNCFKSAKVTFPVLEGITTIGNHAFDCSTNTWSKLPDSLTSLGLGAFGECATTIKEIPTGVTKICNNCLNANNSGYIRLPHTTKVTADKGTENYYKPFKANTYILVPTEDLITEYKADTTWALGVSGYGYKFVIDGFINFDETETGTIKANLLAAGIGGEVLEDEISYYEAVKCTNTTFQNVARPSVECSFDLFKYFENITSLKVAAFLSSKLTSITLPKNLTTLLLAVFLDSVKLTTVTATTPLKIIGDRCFANEKTSNTSVLVNIDLSKVTSLGSKSFYRCNSLTSVDLSSLTTSDGDYIFYGCSSLKDVTWGATTIPSYCFLESGLENLTLLKSLTSIGTFSLANTKLKEFTVPATVTSLGTAVFRACSKLETVTYNASANISDECFYASKIQKVDASAGKFTSIGVLAFDGVTTLTEFDFPSTITTIAKYAFRNCLSLAITELPDSITTINEHAFENCYGLTITKLPDSLTTMRYGAFAGSTGINIKAIPAGVTVVNNHIMSTNQSDYVALKHTDAMVTYDIGTLTTSKPFTANTYIGVPEALLEDYKADSAWTATATANNYKFVVDDYIHFAEEGEGTAKDVLLTNGVGGTVESDLIYYYEAEKVTSIDTWFLNNTTMKSFDEFKYFTGVTSLNNNAFANCTALTSIKFPDSITAITNNADTFRTTTIKDFDFCNITSAKVYLPSTTTSIRIRKPLSLLEIYNFYWYRYMTSLANIYIYDDITNWFKSSVDAYAKSNVKLYLDDVEVTELTIPDDYTSVKVGCCCCMPDITKVTIPSSVVAIGKSAFKSYNSSSTRAIEFNFEDVSQIKTIGILAFQYERGALPAELFTNVTSLGAAAFLGCKGFPTDDIVMDNITAVPYYCFQDSNIKSFSGANITSTLTLYSETEGCFRGATSLTTVNTPKLKSIAAGSFYGCTKLTKIVWDTTLLTTIGAKAFANTNSLTDIGGELPDTITTLGKHAFDSSSVSITKLPSGVSGTLNHGIFNSCSNVNITELPESITGIGNSVFYNCSKMKYIAIKYKDGIVTGDRGSYGFKFRTFPNYCYILVDSQELIDAYKADSIWAEGISNSHWTFVLDGNISFAEIGEGTAKQTLLDNGIGGTLTENEVSYYDAAKCTDISSYFRGNTTMTSFDEFLYFTRLTTIEQDAFNNCTSLTSITLPNSVTSIGDTAFSGCTALATITFAGTIAQWKAITRGTDWHLNVPATTVTCSDGTCGLDETE